MSLVVWGLGCLIVAALEQPGFGKEQVFANAAPFEVSPVAPLTREGIEDALAQARTLLAIFEAPWCGQCRKYSAQLAKLKLFLDDHQSHLSSWLPLNFQMGGINVDKNLEVIKDWGIEWIPTTLLFKEDGYVADFPGPWKAANLLLWLHEELTEQPIYNIHSHILMTDLISFMGEMAVLCHCTDPARLAHEWPKELPLISASDEVCSVMFAKQYTECALLYRNSASVPFRHITINESQAVRWDLLPSLSGPIRLSRATYYEVFSTEYPLLLTTYPSTLTNEEIDHARDLAMKIKPPTVVLAEMGVETPFEKRLLDFLGLSTLWDTDQSVAMTFSPPPLLLLMKPTKAFLPKYAVANLPRPSRLTEIEAPQLLDLSHFWLFPPAEQWINQSTVELQGWIRSALDGSTSPTIMKTEANDYRPDGPITHLSAQGLEILMSNRKSNIVLYARTSWCAHCIKLDPIFKKVAETYSANEILFATLNLDLNALPLFKVINPSSGVVEYRNLIHEGPPLILFITSSHDVPIVYDGERTSHALSEAVAYHFAHLRLPHGADEL